MSVTISWIEKPLDQKHEAKRELDQPKIGRKARRDGTAETIAIAFPANGSVKYAPPWEQIARDNCNWDHGKIADAFKLFCKSKGIQLDAKNIGRIFTNSCKKQIKL